MLKDKMDNIEFAKTKNKTMLLSGKQKVFPSQRFLLLHSIVRLDSFEWSSLFLCGKETPKNLKFYFQRYIYSSGPRMDGIRQEVANIAVHFPETSNLFTNLTKLIRESFMY